MSARAIEAAGSVTEYRGNCGTPTQGKRGKIAERGEDGLSTPTRIEVTPPSAAAGGGLAVGTAGVGQQLPIGQRIKRANLISD